MVRQVEVGRLVLVVRDDELLDVAEHHVPLLDLLLLVQREAEHRLRCRARASSGRDRGTAASRSCDVGVDQDHVDEGIEVVRLAAVPLAGLRLARFFWAISSPILRSWICILPILLEPRDAALERPGTRATPFCCAICRPWTTTAVVCGIGVFAEPAEPAPAAVGELHLGEAFDADFDHPLDLGLVEHRVPGGIVPFLVPRRRPPPASGASPISWAFRFVRLAWIALRSSFIRFRMFCVMTVGRKRLRVCSVHPYG